MTIYNVSIEVKPGGRVHLTGDLFNTPLVCVDVRDATNNLYDRIKNAEAIAKCPWPVGTVVKNDQSLVQVTGPSSYGGCFKGKNLLTGRSDDFILTGNTWEVVL